jgi:hypothetical protein
MNTVTRYRLLDLTVDLAPAGAAIRKKLAKLP